MSTLRVTFFTFPVRGHVAPALGVIEELRARGATVFAMAAEAHRSALEGAGASVAAYPEAFVERFAHPSNNFLQVAADLAEVTVGEMLARAEAFVAETQPGVVLVDSMAPWGRLAAEAAGLPAVTSTSSFVVSARLGASVGAAVDVVRRAGTAVSALRTIHRARGQVGASHRLDLGSPLGLLSNRADATLVYTSAELQPGAQHFDPSVHFVGPTAAERPFVAAPAPSGELAALLDDAAQGRPLAYVALGTLYNARPRFLGACVDALATGDRGVVVATGARTAPGVLGPLPRGAVAVADAPQLAILDRAELFVTHGGLNSVHEALWRGVPMVVFPQAADQPVVGARLRQLGAARVLRGREPSADAIRRAAEQVLSGGAATVAAERLGRGLRTAGGATGAADVIFRLAEASG